MKNCSILILIFLLALGHSVQAKDFDQQMYTYQLMKKDLLSIAKEYDLEVKTFGQ